ncbi:hypothetical protein PULV_b0127 [Pseudoalteromonas ulvae UL12]|uniref:diguanylate cyclase n=1 Tax=Pseudoalteromonas ulvae TaxID=107327 RepID=A0A244CQS9_PSEDV|nr:diguanylate cyclase [Pseudoalteromonas ulvae]MBE0365535.1 hypothetical protein [Pseudoalteromonas ulvae UL12]OUL57980.1 hypothetical protein B1199_06350 [Pseudoalteromonas ulvae]
MNAKYLSVYQLLVPFLFMLFSSQLLANHSLELKNQSSLFIKDEYLWRKVPDTRNDFHNPLQIWQSSSQPSATLVGQSGVFITKLAINNHDRKTWFLVPNANFVDLGLAYWQPINHDAIKVRDFSQPTATLTPQLLHFQSVPLQFKPAESGTLWLYISAKHFASPLSLTIYDELSFYRFQSINNSISLAAISTMLLLSVLTFLIYTRTGERIAITCAGYVGLHGIGWAMAAGLVEDFSISPEVNLSYSAIYIFPFAIACASQFVADLFQCKSKFKKLCQTLNTVTLVGLFLGVTMLFLPFKLAFYSSHLLAMTWIALTLFVGIYMLKENDFRAKYFLVGNLLYSASLIYYMASHSKQFGQLEYPELMVVMALSIDCICIVLSLSEWFKLKQNEYNHHFYMSRIDPLTQLGNRYALDDTISHLCKQYIFIYLDFDGLKIINDKFGHNEGDKLIRSGAKLIEKSVTPFGKVFRVGGDEFICIITDESTDNINQLKQTYSESLNKVNAQIKQTWQEAGISFGIVSNEDGQSPSDCLSIADKKMYQQKKQKLAPS